MIILDRLFVQSIVLGVALSGIVIWIYWGWMNRKRWLYAVAPITWLLHVAIFYTAVLIQEPPFFSDVYATWSSVIRLHGVILAAGAGIILLVQKKHE